MLSHFSRVRLCVTPQTVAYQALPSLGFSRQEHWSGLPFPSPCMKVKSESEVAQSCPTLSDPMDCSLPGSSVHGIFQARVLEWGAIRYSKMYPFIQYGREILQRRKWQLIPVFLPRESCGQRNVVGGCPWGRTESDTTEATQHACMHWRRKWQPTPVFLPGESQGLRSLMGCRLQSHTELDTTEVTWQQQQQQRY